MLLYVGISCWLVQPGNELLLVAVRSANVGIISAVEIDYGHCYTRPAELYSDGGRICLGLLYGGNRWQCFGT